MATATIPNFVWAQFKTLIDVSAKNNFFNEEVTWRRFQYRVDRYGEDEEEPGTDDETLEALMFYNFFRTWPIDKVEETGQIDRVSVTMILNRAWLDENDFLDDEGNFNFQMEDRFIHRGIVYKDSGYTLVSQSKEPLTGKGDPLLVMVILVRDEIETTKKRGDG